MEDKYIVWLGIIGVGAVLGVFLRLAVVVRVLFGMLAFTLVGGFAAIFLKLIQGEWLYVLMAAPVVAFWVFVAAVVSNLLIGPK